MTTHYYRTLKPGHESRHEKKAQKQKYFPVVCFFHGVSKLEAKCLTELRSESSWRLVEDEKVYVERLVDWDKTIRFCHHSSLSMVRFCFKCSKSDFGFSCFLVFWFLVFSPASTVFVYRQGNVGTALPLCLPSCLIVWGWLRAICLHDSANFSAQSTRISCGPRRQTSSKVFKRPPYTSFVVCVKTCVLTL